MWREEVTAILHMSNCIYSVVACFTFTESEILPLQLFLVGKYEEKEQKDDLLNIIISAHVFFLKLKKVEMWLKEWTVLLMLWHSPCRMTSRGKCAVLLPWAWWSWVSERSQPKQTMSTWHLDSTDKCMVIISGTFQRNPPMCVPPAPSKRF